VDSCLVINLGKSVKNTLAYFAAPSVVKKESL